MFDDLRDLYQEVILDHGRHPRHGRRLTAFDATAKGDNPMCGDRVQVWLRRNGDAVAELGFEARGCELTVASADLMCETAAGRTADEVRALSARVARMARSGHCDSRDGALTRLRPLSAVHEYPSRVRCVTLPWSALVAALDGAKEAAGE